MGPGRRAATRRPRARGLLLTDLPNHARPGNLHEWAVARDLELGRRVRLAEVPHRAVIHQVGTVVRPEPQVRGAVDAANAVGERLVEGGVVGKPLLAELQWGPQLTEVHEFDIVPRLRLAIRRREAKVALAGDQRRAALDNP